MLILLDRRGVMRGPFGPLGDSVHDRPEFLPHFPDRSLQVLQGTSDRLIGVFGVELLSEVALERPAGVPTLPEAGDRSSDGIKLAWRGLSQWHCHSLIFGFCLRRPGCKACLLGVNKIGRYSLRSSGRSDPWGLVDLSDNL